MLDEQLNGNVIEIESPKVNFLKMIFLVQEKLIEISSCLR